MSASGVTACTAFSNLPGVKNGFCDKPFSSTRLPSSSKNGLMTGVNNNGDVGATNPSKNGLVSKTGFFVSI